MLFTSLMLVAVLFLCGLFCTCNLHSLPVKLRAWLQIPNRPSSFQSSHTQAGSMQAEPTSSTQQVAGRESTSKAAAVSDDRAEVSMAFETFDSDGDGVITVEELWRSLTRMGISSSDKDVADMIQRLDSNGDGVLDIDEFRELYRSVGRTTRPSVAGGQAGGGDADGGHRGTAVVSGEVGGGKRGDEEEANMREAFDVFDGDRDGHITVHELNTVLKSMGLKEGYTPASCQEMISKVDMDGDGRVSFEEFKLMMKFQ